MATGKKKSIDEMKWIELTEILKDLGLSDEGVENIGDVRSRIRSALNQLNTAEKTSNWSPGKVRYFSVSEGFSTSTSLAGVHARVSFKRSDIS